MQKQFSQSTGAPRCKARSTSHLCRVKRAVGREGHAPGRLLFREYLRLLHEDEGSSGLQAEYSLSLTARESLAPATPIDVLPCGLAAPPK